MPIVVRGGFAPGVQWWFAALSALALALTLLARRGRTDGAWDSPALLCLAALSAFSVASAGWSEAGPEPAIRAGAMIAAAGALVFAVRLIAGAEPRAAVPLLGLIVLIAIGEALAGSLASVLRAEPLAERIGGSWRPGGTFEYSPALALLCVSALPAVIGVGAVRGGAVRLAAAAVGAAALAVSLGLSDSRLAPALALTALVLVTALAPRLGLGRGRAAALSALALAAGIAAAGLLGGYVGFGVALREGDAGRLATLAAILAAAGLIAAALGRSGALDSPDEAAGPAFRRRTRPTRSALAAGGALTLLVVVVALAAGVTQGSAVERLGVEGDGGITHGRGEQWSAAIDAGAERPLGGWGAGAYTIAAADQGATFALYAHSLPLETWAELGLPGAALVLALYAACALVAWRARGSRTGLLAGWVLICFGLANLVDWPWHLAGSLAVFAVALGLVLAAAPRGPKVTA